MKRDVRNLDLDGVRILLDWAAAEGWNPGLGDAEAFHAADPNGYFGAFVDGNMVAGISAVAYDENFGFIGLYICHPYWRGQGHGRAVWDAAMTYLGDRTIGLDGVPQQQAQYTAMGFVGAYQTIRMSGTLLSGEQPSQCLHTDDLTTLDRRYFPASRDEFLAYWLAPPNQCSTIYRQQALVGYAVGRQCSDGLKLGPIFASSLDDAITLLNQYEGACQIDVPVAQTAWLDHLSRLGFTGGFSTLRMYRGAPPAMEMAGVFGITSLELG